MPGGKRMAVLAGCNYPGSPLSELKGCINDVVSMKEVLISRFGFKEENIELLTDEPTSRNQPTGANIKKALERMIKQAEDGDLLVFHFSGHGTHLKHHQNHVAIIPTDYNIITDMDFRHFVSMIDHKATFTILADSCCSGGLIYQEKEQIGPSTNPSKPKCNSCKRKFIPIEDIQNMFQQNSGLNLNIGDFMRLNFRDNASLTFQHNFHPNLIQPIGGFAFNIGKPYDNGILLSACQKDEYASDYQASNPPHGVFSYAVMTALKNSGQGISNRQLVMQVRESVKAYQHPCLYSSDKNADATFLLEGQANTN